jgi:beta-ribofuranosylaminobenzene 5'-phosphate synthase
MSKVFITAYPRLHISLLSMGTGYRRNGGLGFAINCPDITISATSAQTLDFEDRRSRPVSDEELSGHLAVLRAVRDSYELQPAHITLTGRAQPHIGLGTGTATRLAAVEALFLLSSRAYTQESLVMASRRGGASGVGINTYFEGGLVFDLGIPNVGQVFHSSEAPPSQIERPLHLKRIGMPSWRVGICVPRRIRTLSIEEEESFFLRSCPISNGAVYESTYLASLGCYAAARENLFSTFCDAVARLQTCEWKRLERELYGEDLQRLQDALYEGGARSVGMSSLGPTLFFLLDSETERFWTDDARFKDCDVEEVAIRNSGRIVRHA